MNRKRRSKPRMTKDEISSQIEDCVAGCLSECGILKMRLHDSAKETLAQRMRKLLFKNRRF